MDEPAVHPRLRDRDVLAALRETWRRDGCLRIESVLAPGLAASLAPALIALPFAAYRKDDEHARCFFWRCIIEIPPPGAPLPPPPFDAIARFIGRDLTELASAVSGRSLRGLVRDWIPVCRWRKGSFLDAHEDYGVGRAIAYVLGLTRETWPAEHGGHLEFLASDRETVLERRAPGFDTLDLYDVRPVERWHRVPLLVEHHERLTVSGWIAGSETSGSEAVTG
jgi:hypothetical protein